MTINATASTVTVVVWTQRIEPGSSEYNDERDMKSNRIETKRYYV